MAAQVTKEEGPLAPDRRAQSHKEPLTCGCRQGTWQEDEAAPLGQPDGASVGHGLEHIHIS